MKHECMLFGVCWLPDTKGEYAIAARMVDNAAGQMAVCIPMVMLGHFQPHPNPNQLKLLSIACEFHVHEAPMGPTSSVATATTDRRKAYFADTDALHPCRYVQPRPLHRPFDLHQRQPGVQWSCSLKLLTAGLWDANHSCTRMLYLTSENYLS